MPATQGKGSVDWHPQADFRHGPFHAPHSDPLHTEALDLIENDPEYIAYGQVPGFDVLGLALSTLRARENSDLHNSEPEPEPAKKPKPIKTVYVVSRSVVNPR